ncbi:hypothetical protein ABIA45_007788 [Bradyrhizobium sp. USDA 336]
MGVTTSQQVFNVGGISFFRASIGRDDEEKVPPCLVNTEQEQI